MKPLIFIMLIACYGCIPDPRLQLDLSNKSTNHTESQQVHIVIYNYGTINFNDFMAKVHKGYKMDGWDEYRHYLKNRNDAVEREILRQESIKNRTTFDEPVISPEYEKFKLNGPTKFNPVTNTSKPVEREIPNKFVPVSSLGRPVTINR